MAYTRFLLLLCLSLAACTSREMETRREAARAAARNESTAPAQRLPYRLGPGDSVRIEHAFNEELSRVVALRSDGYVTLPVIGDVDLADRTLPEAGAVLEERYSGTVRTPRVTVALETSANLRICVAGEVNNPGMFTLSDGLTALRAITLAGGARATAGLRSVVVVRDRGTPEPEYLLVDVQEATSALNGSHDLRLRPKDIVFVPRSRIAAMNAFVDQYMNQLIPFQKNLGVTYIVGKGFL